MKSNQKNIFLALVAMLFVVAAYAVNPPKGQQVKIKTSAQCDMCKERIEKNLSLTKGVKLADLDVETKVVTITFNPKQTSVEKLKQIIVNTGYDADELVCNQSAHDKLPSCCQKDAEPHGHKH